MQLDSLASEMLQLSASTHAWRQRHRDESPIAALADLRPALETFHSGAVARQLDEPRVRRLAATAVRLALAPRDRALVGHVLHGVDAMLGELYASPGLGQAPRAD